ncbi:hypothetical protein AKJ44_02420 [candidate division MSBL1 archaeon SCGC-AAA261F17]|uniref:Uncharacterized protein n=1 Tax=candidate division MSBL1 archaeon SCGC-AAA261F17 TaxID=1698274 RepID=A0A133V523_9EURY|nr:hypothetical protein AKJ44_02420 [candidate division MSBL1 archaeon SCGC-AAA261F17]
MAEEGEGPVCAVPGCERELSEEQVESGMVVCEKCEAAKMHLCEACGKKLSPEQIQAGAVLCENCEERLEMGIDYEIE